MDGQEHLDDVLAGREEVVGLVEQAVAQSGTDEDAEEAVDEEWVEDVLFLFLPVLHDSPDGDALLVEQFSDDDVGQCQSDEPAQRVPADRSESEARVPGDVK